MSGIASIRTALETALNGMSPALSTAFENAAFAPVSGTAYQKVNLLTAEPDNSAYGSHYIEQGIFQVTLMYPLQTGPAAAAARAELIRSTFYRGASFTSGGISVIVNKTPSISPGSVDGDRWMVPVKISWFAYV